MEIVWKITVLAGCLIVSELLPLLPIKANGIVHTIVIIVTRLVSGEITLQRQDAQHSNSSVLPTQTSNYEDIIRALVEKIEAMTNARGDEQHERSVQTSSDDDLVLGLPNINEDLNFPDEANEDPTQQNEENDDDPNLTRVV